MAKRKRIAGMAAALFVAVILLVIYLLQHDSQTLTEYVRSLEESGRSRQNVVVAVIDSGYTGWGEYEDRILEGYDFVHEDMEPEDEYGHGTRIASLILDNTPEQVKVLPLKVADRSGSADVADVCRALEYAADKKADMINLSLNVIMETRESDTLNATIRELTQKGITVIVSAGNNNLDVEDLSPAGVEGVISVGAVDELKKPYFFSGYGENVSFCSLGKYEEELGSSYSAAYVTSAASILKMYGVDSVEEVLLRYGESYLNSEKCCGKRYVWLETFHAKGNGAKDREKGFELAAFSSVKAGELGADILELDWKDLDPKILEAYLLGTDKGYVGMFLKSLSKEDLALLKEKCPVLCSEVSVTSCNWDQTTESFRASKRTQCDFIQYCIWQYEEKAGRMTVSDWLIRNTTMVFYISNEDRSVKYRYEIHGNIHDKAAGIKEENVLGMDGSLTLVAFGEEDPYFKKPRLGDAGIRTYATGFSSRWVAYEGVEVENGTITAKDFNEQFNTVNGSDNGNIFYGISIPFTGVTLSTRSGFHYDPDNIKAYKYNTNEDAQVRRYAHLSYEGWVYDDLPEIARLEAGFRKLSGILSAVKYTAKRNQDGSFVYGENTYQYCPDPTMISKEEAQKFYDIEEHQVYRLTNLTSFDVERGEMTLNTDIFSASSLDFYDTYNNKIIYANDIAEYVIAQEPNDYQVCLDANFGTMPHVETGESVPMTEVTVCYGCENYNDIGWAEPYREGFLFQGWYTDRDYGEEIWDVSGRAKESVYWNHGIWNYTDAWSADNNHLVFYARWNPVRYSIHFDANGGSGSTMDMEELLYGREYILSDGDGLWRESFGFLGWNTMPDGSGIGYKGSDIYRRDYGNHGDIVTLYAQWQFIDTIPPEITVGPPEGLSPESTWDHLIYGWTNHDIQLDFSAEDLEMQSIILYEEETGNILAQGISQISHTVSDSGIFHFSLVATDRSGNTASRRITTKIDRVAPKGELEISYDGRVLDIMLHHIVEENQEHPDNEASGCRSAWVCLRGLDGQGNEICREERQLMLATPDNIYTGAVYEGSFRLGNELNYSSEYIGITAYIVDHAGNYLPEAGAKTIPAFVLWADMERCLGEAVSWKAGEAGIIEIKAAAYVDSIKVFFPAEWTESDAELENPVFEYPVSERAFEKKEEIIFYIPLRADDGTYKIKVSAYKDGYEKFVEFSLNTSGSILDELRTRLR